VVTREQKLALIVGFSLVLLVGVLISDHMSEVRHQSIDGVEEAEALPASEPVARWNPMVLGPGATPEAEGDPLEWAKGSASERVVPGESDWGGTAAQPERHEGPAANDENETVAPDPVVEITQSPELAADDRSSVEVESIPGLGPDLRGFRLELPRPAAVVDRPGLDLVREDRSERRSSTPTSAEREAEGEREGVWHVVERGESLYVIAKRYYGKGSEWKRIVEANPERIGADGETVRVGVRLRIPGVAPSEVKPEKQRGRGATGGSAPPRKYTVRKGDTLGEIAQRLLGTSKRWREILRLNDLEDARRVREGMVLEIPGA